MLKKVPGFICIVFAFCFLLCSAVADRLVLPSSLKTIEDEAFMNDSSIDQIVLPEQLDSIGRKAFAYTNLTSAYLPPSIRYIAPDAFEGCKLRALLADDGSYAASWCAANGINWVSASETAALESCLIKGYVNLYSGMKFDYNVLDKEPLNSDLTFESGLSNILSVTSDGKAIAGQPGQATVIVRSNGVYFLDISVTVYPQIEVRPLTFSWNASHDAYLVNNMMMPQERLYAKGSLRPAVLSYSSPDTTIIPASGELPFDGNYLMIRDQSRWHAEIIDGEEWIHLLRTGGEGESYVDIRDICQIDAITTSEIRKGHIRFYTDENEFVYEITQDGITQNADDYNYVLLDDGTVRLTEYVGEKSLDQLIIPGHIDGRVVSEIGDNVFNEVSSLQSGITIPDTVRSIGSTAFRVYCNGPFVLPNSVTSIGEYAFANSYFLNGVTLSRNLENISAYAFYNCHFPGEFSMPDGVRTIGEHAFDGCDFSGSLQIPNTVETIGDYAFRYCAFDGNVIIPDTVTSIGINVFERCQFSGRIITPKGVSVISDYLFALGIAQGELVITDNIQEIGTGAFMNCGLSEDLLIPGTVRRIGESAFTGITGGSSLILSEGIEAIGINAFLFSEFTGKLMIPSSVQEIGMNAFYGCDHFDKVSVETLDDSGNTVTKEEVAVYCSRSSYAWTWAESTEGFEPVAFETEESTEYGSLYGKIVNADAVSEGLEGVTVILARASVNQHSALRLLSASVDDGLNIVPYKSTTTLSDGSYIFSRIPVGAYIIVARLSGLLEYMGFCDVQANETRYVQTIRMIADTGIGTGSASGKVKNVLTGEGISNANFIIRKGWDNLSSGSIVASGTTDENGNYSVTLNAGYYTFIASANGHIESSINIIVRGGSTESGQDLAISSVADESVYRVVLSWQDNPRDLDSHLTGKLSTGNDFHIYYSSKTAVDRTTTFSLDLDDRNGKGPETITFSQITSSPYYYYVHHYAGDGTLTTSGAQVKVYKGDRLVETFNVPTDQPASSNWNWNVFAIVNGHVVKKNTITQRADTNYAANYHTAPTLSFIQSADDPDNIIENGTCQEYNVANGNLTICWKCDRWDHFIVKAILVNEKPSNDSQEAVTVLTDDAKYTNYKESSITFTKEQLEGAPYLKIAVQGVDAEGNKSNMPWIGFEIKRELLINQKRQEAAGLYTFQQKVEKYQTYRYVYSSDIGDRPDRTGSSYKDSLAYNGCGLFSLVNAYGYLSKKLNAETCEPIIESLYEASCYARQYSYNSLGVVTTAVYDRHINATIETPNNIQITGGKYGEQKGSEMIKEWLQQDSHNFVLISADLSVHYPGCGYNGSHFTIFVDYFVDADGKLYLLQIDSNATGKGGYKTTGLREEMNIGGAGWMSAETIDSYSSYKFNRFKFNDFTFYPGNDWPNKETIKVFSAPGTELSTIDNKDPITVLGSNGDYYLARIQRGYKAHFTEVYEAYVLKTDVDLSDVSKARINE